MKSLMLFKAIGLMVITLIACSPISEPTQFEDTEPTKLPTLEPTQFEVTDTAIPPITYSWELKEPGSFFVGRRWYTLIDHEHDDRKIRISIFYPAIKKLDANGREIVEDAAPDMSGAPYPLILTEFDSAKLIYKDHLASHGFVMVAITPAGKYEEGYDFYVVDTPRDFLFVLDQISLGELDGLNGIADAEHVGVTGYSYGGDISLTLGGRRIDPEYYLNYCKDPPFIEPKELGAEWYSNFVCLLAGKWDAFLSHVGSEMTSSTDGLWQPITDERIKAVMPMAPSEAWLYGEKGLAAVDRPTLLIAAMEDQFTPYQIETRFVFENLGAQDKALISFIGQDHFMPLQFGAVFRMRHFATAFFGYHLQGKDEYRQFYSEEFCTQMDGVAWGMVEEN